MPENAQKAVLESMKRQAALVERDQMKKAAAAKKEAEKKKKLAAKKEAERKAKELARAEAAATKAKKEPRIVDITDEEEVKDETVATEAVDATAAPEVGEDGEKEEYKGEGKSIIPIRFESPSCFQQKLIFSPF